MFRSWPLIADLEHYADGVEDAYQLCYVNRPPVYRSYLDLLGFDNL
jgi:hypothetical protein